MCDIKLKNLILAPLPNKKQLWEADDQFSWKVELGKNTGAQTLFGLAASGELVILEDDYPRKDGMLVQRSSDAGPPQRSTANWEEWCSGMDGLGGLVMLAASLVG